METRRFDHIDLRVTDVTAAKAFYAQVLPAIGFTTEVPDSSGTWCMWQAIGSGPVEFFGFTEDRDHRPNESRIAFWAESREDVDRVAEVVRRAGGLNWKDRRFAPNTRPAIMRSSSKTRAATSWKSAFVAAWPVEVAAPFVRVEK